MTQEKKQIYNSTGDKAGCHCYTEHLIKYTVDSKMSARNLRRMQSIESAELVMGAEHKPISELIH